MLAPWVQSPAAAEREGMMSEAARYKQKGRTFEQRENWDRAIEAYELAIEADISAHRDVDLSLYNRIGDLYRRTGDVNKAVHYYEQAAEGHISAGFYNNAIALCNKILRNQPNRHSTYLKLGKIGAAKGFLSDARKHFLEYAERMQKADQLDHAFAALIEFADLSPDPDVRLMIADQLIEDDRTAQAVDQLRQAWSDLRSDGREAHADDIRERILHIAPDRDPEVDPPEASTSIVIDAEGVIDLPELDLYPDPEPESVSTEEAEAVDEAELEIVHTVIDDPVAEVEEESVPSPGGELGLEPIALGSEEPETEEEEKEEKEEEEEAVAVEPEPEPEADWEEPQDDVGSLVSAIEDEFAEAIIEEPTAAEPEAAESEEPAAAGTQIADLEAHLESEGPDPSVLVELADALLETGDRENATGRLWEALVLRETRGEFREAENVLDELIRLNVNDMRAYQKRVELAFRLGDRAALVTAYLELADCLDRTDAGDKARAIYVRVLDLDPSNVRALAAVEMLGGNSESTEAAGAGARTSGSGDYVDLGSLVLEEESDSQSTRFVMSAGDPQSEDEVNFSDMLNQFRSKVAETIEEEDASSHYDLGVAFKEMGLLDEAIAEFQIAARGLDFRLRAIEMLGACFMEKEDYQIALKVLGRALQVAGYKDEDLVGIFYALGRAHEALGQADRSLEWYQRVLGCDLAFRDVAERVSGLQS